MLHLLTVDLVSPERHPGSVVTMDLPSAMLILQENIASNRAVMTICTTEAAVLDWDDEQLGSSVQARLEDGQDVIVYVCLSLSRPACLNTDPPSVDAYTQHGGCHVQHRALFRIRQFQV
ncbi:hypothetical protein JVT61DRAFT_12600 [Boletus reticuloceps]|uniref:Uncharacterized protein n=1 Tax=Boletus reticuloceps TaxID=495285 RepID=A0A8I2YDG5_9AGAM|nr:hypothetical protein JVT61DRAFT_12600 [Boletus reticuloceps]